MSHMELARKRQRAGDATTGGLLKRGRKRAGLTQVELGEQIGKQDSSISSYESGRDNPPVAVLRKLAKVLRLSFLEPIEEVNHVPRSRLGRKELDALPLLKPKEFADLTDGAPMVTIMMTDKSMKPGIPKGALLAVDRRQTDADKLNGKTVVIRHRGAALVRRLLFNREGRMVCWADNPTASFLSVELNPDDEGVIIGRVISVHAKIKS